MLLMVKPITYILKWRIRILLMARGKLFLRVTVMSVGLTAEPSVSWSLPCEVLFVLLPRSTRKSSCVMPVTQRSLRECWNCSSLPGFFCQTD